MFEDTGGYFTFMETPGNPMSDHRDLSRHFCPWFSHVDPDFSHMESIKHLINMENDGTMEVSLFLQCGAPQWC